MKQTKQKSAILGAVKQLGNHPTAVEVYDHLRRDAPRLSLGTVYRNLNRFAEQGLLLQLPLYNITRYDACCDAHVHFYCTQCGTIHDVDVPENISPCDWIPAHIGEVHQCALTLSGLCVHCREHIDTHNEPDEV